MTAEEDDGRGREPEATGTGEENLEAYRRGVAALNAREFSDELFAELCTPDFSMENTSTAISDRTYSGVEGIREWLRDAFDGFDADARYESVEVLAVGADFVVSIVRLVGLGARSGAPLELRWVAVNWFRAGKITRGAGYLTRRDALEAVRLTE